MARNNAAARLGDAIEPRFTIDQFASMHSVSRTTVRKWIDQGRIAFKRQGGKGVRAAAVLIYQRERPPRLVPGALTEDQRKAWRR
jgi:excisionase family DNA binding protein